MKVSSNRIYTGQVLVNVRTNFCDKISVVFNTRHDAAVFLSALRKRAKR